MASSRTPISPQRNAVPATPIKPVVPSLRAPHVDPQPNATQIKPGAADTSARHLSAAAQHKPTRHQIERRAYEIWLRRGGGDGNAAVDWLQAERELLTEIKAHNAD